MEFMYDFSCFLERRGDILSGGAAAATTIHYAKQFMTDHDSDINSFISKVRMHLQTVNPYPFSNVLSPGSWHMTFFGVVHYII